MPFDSSSALGSAAKKVLQPEEETAAKDNPKLIKGRDPNLISSYRQKPEFGTSTFATTSRSLANHICKGRAKRVVTPDQKTPRKLRGAE